MRSDSHPARERLLMAGRAIPGVWDKMAELRTAHPPENHCAYISEAAAAEAVLAAGAEHHGPQWIQGLRGLGPLGITRLVQPYTTLGAWRMTQGIYRIDPTLYAALIDTPLAGDLPAQVLMRLPEWCIYVETPGLPIAGVDGSTYTARGMWARCYEDADAQVLVVAIDVPEAETLECQHIPLGRSLTESLQELVRDWRNSGVHTPTEAELGTALGYIAPAINLLLYLCSTVDIAGTGQPGNPTPTRTKRGPKLFPAATPRAWDVGVRMGSALRAAYAAVDAGGAHGQGSTVRGHVRRAHWHGFRSGPRLRADGSAIPADARRFELRWLPPIPVNLPDLDTMPSVIRPVR